MTFSSAGTAAPWHKLWARRALSDESRLGYVSAPVIIALIAVAAFLFLVLVGPFLIPVPPLRDTVPPRQLADPDSQFAEVNGIQVHLKVVGQGNPTLLLLHGLAANLLSWQRVLEPLSHAGTVIAFDRAGFGLTSRPMSGEWSGANPYSTQSQVNTAIGLMDRWGVDQAVLIGHSAGGTIAALAALHYPERVRALVLVDPAVYRVARGLPSWLRLLLRTPQMRHLGPLVVRHLPSRRERLIALAWHDPTRATPEVLAGYARPLHAQNWDRALWEFTLAVQSFDLPAHLAEITAPVLVITGDKDRVIPTAQSVRLASELPDARLVIVPECGHIPQEEQPQAFVQATLCFLSGLK